MPCHGQSFIMHIIMNEVLRFKRPFSQGSQFKMSKLETLKYIFHLTHVQFPSLITRLLRKAVFQSAKSVVADSKWAAFIQPLSETKNPLFQKLLFTLLFFVGGGGLLPFTSRHSGIMWRHQGVICFACWFHACYQSDCHSSLCLFQRRKKSAHTSPSVFVGYHCSVWMLLMAWCLQLRLLHQFSPVYRSWAREVLHSDSHHQSPTSAPCLHAALPVHPSSEKHIYTQHLCLVCPLYSQLIASNSSHTVQILSYNTATDSISHKPSVEAVS